MASKAIVSDGIETIGDPVLVEQGLSDHRAIHATGSGKAERAGHMKVKLGVVSGHHDAGHHIREPLHSVRLCTEINESCGEIFCREPDPEYLEIFGPVIESGGLKVHNQRAGFDSGEIHLCLQMKMPGLSPGVVTRSPYQSAFTGDFSCALLLGAFSLLASPLAEVTKRPLLGQNSPLSAAEPSCSCAPSWFTLMPPALTTFS